MNLKGVSQVFGINSTNFTADPSAHALGTIGYDRAGRRYRWAKAGAVDLVAGNALQSPAIVANHLANTPPVVNAGDTSFVYTPGATAGAANLYAGGLMQVDTTPGNGRAYGVKGHLAITSSTAFTLNLETDDAVQIALTASSRVGLFQNPYNGVIQFPVTTATGVLVGVAVSAIPATNYGWIGVGGYFPALIAGTPALGAAVLSPGTTAGASVVMTTTNLVVAQVLGYMAQVGVDGKNNMVFVNLP